MSGGYDSLVNIYTIQRNSKEQKISLKLALKGHINSIRDISFIDKNVFPGFEQKFIASCSQDFYIRIWSIKKIENIKIDEKKIDSIFEEYTNKTSFVLKTENNKLYNVLLDSVLSGHEDSVSSVRWGIRNSKLVLLSSSFDFTVSIWEYDTQHVNFHNIRIFGIKVLP